MMTRELISLGETPSTNTWLRHYAPQARADITAVTARHQTAGRGQGSHRWEDTGGDSLLLSLLIRPAAVPVARQFALSMAHALAVRDALGLYTDGIELKWPNDTYWHGRKLGGTLIETTLAAGAIHDMIIGTGINVRQTAFAIDAPNPVSLRQITGRDIATADVLHALLDAFESRYRQALGGDYAGISRQYHAALWRREGFHAYKDKDGEFLARTDGVDDGGRIHLTDTLGRQRAYAFGEIETINQQPK